MTGGWTEEQIDAYYGLLGRNVRRLRLDAGLTQRQIADVAGLARSSVANLECGRQRSPVHTIWLIAKALGADLGTVAPDAGDGLSTHLIVQETIREQAREIGRLRGKLGRIRAVLGGRD